MLVENWLGTPLHYLSLKTNFRHDDSSVGHDAVVEKVEIIAADDADSYHLMLYSLGLSWFWLL